jgi:beta-fructofuranosidase
MKHDETIPSCTPAARDRHRPAYHFLPPANWMNDPNGLMQWQGRYHLFYQYNPNGPFWGTMHWGHAASADLVHWEHLPSALAPTPGTADEDGCWSGCAVDDDGVPTLIYSGNRAGQQRTCLAISHDNLLTWQKLPINPVVANTPPDLDLVCFRDPYVWREDGIWYQLVGAGIKGVGGTALLYRSADLRTWEYLHPLCTGDIHQTEPLWTGGMWECPAFFPLGDAHVLIVSVWSEERLYYSIAMAGTYADHHFTPETIQKLDWGDQHFYAPQTLLDDQGRRLVWGWVQEGRSIEAQRSAGWAGVLSLPRILTLSADRRVRSQPVPELRALRGDHKRHILADLGPQTSNALPDLRGDALELIAVFDPGTAEQVGLKLCCAADATEETCIYYDLARQQIVLDRRRSCRDATTHRDSQAGPCGRDASGRVVLQIFLDHSVVEVFTPGGFCLTSRIYPTCPDSLGVDVIVRGGIAKQLALESWTLRSIW